MDIKGINYDIGTTYYTTSTRENLTITKIKKELEFIKNRLNCNAIRIYGGNIKRLFEASECALKLGLEVWISPRFVNETPEKTFKLVEKCAKKSEKLRIRYKKVVFIVGNEISLDSPGFIEGKYHGDRGEVLGKGSLDWRDLSKRINDYLKKLKLSCNSFKGKLTYASGLWEWVDWNLFDIIGVNKYMAKWNEKNYVNELRELKKYNKPVAITEFGCRCYKGAADQGPGGWEITDWSKKEIRGNAKRDEKEQSNHIKKLFKIFNKEGIYATFPYTFFEPRYIHSNDPRKDLEMASFNIVYYKNGQIIEKESVKVIAEEYKRK